MLDVMRKHSQSFLIYLIFGAIIVVFAVNFGPGSSGCQPGETAGWAATVNGETVRQEEFALTFGRRVDARRRGNATLSDAQRNALRKQVIDELIQAKAIAQEAARLGLTASDDELLEFLKANYGVDKVTFDTYQNWVRRTFRTSVSTFESDVRSEIARKKLIDSVRENITVSEEEVKEEFVRDRDRAMLTFVRFDVQAAGAKEPTEAEVQALLGSDEEGVKAYHGQRRFDYVTPMQVRLRHILLSLPTDASDADVARLRGKLLEIKGQLDQGADFAALAKKHSEDESSKAAGGDLGLRKRGDLDRAVANAAFSLEAGQISSEPVRSASGLHLIRVDEKVPAKDRPYEEVKVEVARALLKERQQDQRVQKQAAALLEKLKRGGDIEKLTVTQQEAAEGAAARPIRRDSAWILASGGEGVPGIGLSAELHGAVFAASGEGEVLDQVYKVGRSYFVCQLKKRETPDMEEFEKEKDRLRDFKQYSKSQLLLGEWIKDLSKRATVKLNPALFPELGSGNG